jgi:hypothetical protein
MLNQRFPDLFVSWICIHSVKRLKCFEVVQVSSPGLCTIMIIIIVIIIKIIIIKNVEYNNDIITIIMLY